VVGGRMVAPSVQCPELRHDASDVGDTAWERAYPDLLTEWAYARPWKSNRQHGLDQHPHHYNARRGPSALGGERPISRLAD